MGPYPDATAVFDIDAIGLTNLVANLNRGLDPGGNAIGKPTSFVIGVGVNPAAVDVPHEIKRFEWKGEAGAAVAATPPRFRPSQPRGVLEKNEHTPPPVWGGDLAPGGGGEPRVPSHYSPR